MGRQLCTSHCREGRDAPSKAVSLGQGWKVEKKDNQCLRFNENLKRKEKNLEVFSVFFFIFFFHISNLTHLNESTKAGSVLIKASATDSVLSNPDVNTSSFILGLYPNHMLTINQICTSETDLDL